MSAPEPVSQDLLMAYADGQLQGADAARVEAWLAASPEAAADIARIRRQDDAIRTLFGPAGAEPVPARLRPVRLAAEAGRRRSRYYAGAAAAIVLLAVGLGAGVALRPLLDAPAGPETRLIADALAAHGVYAAENRHAVEVAAAEDHMVTWLSNRIGTDFVPPDLSGEGFALKGGRLLPAPADAGGRAAQLMYEDAAGERITVYLTGALPDGAAADRVETAGAAAAFYWADARITCTVVGTLPEARMRAMAGAVYRQLAGTGYTYRS